MIIEGVEETEEGWREADGGGVEGAEDGEEGRGDGEALMGVVVEIGTSVIVSAVRGMRELRVCIHVCRIRIN